jgi:AcrR family transcriptional regulator
MSKGTATKSKPEPRRALPRDRRETEIILTAIKVLNKDPNSSIDDIAEAAGVTRQLVSLYFPGGGVQPIVDRIVSNTVPILISAIDAMGDAGDLLTNKDEEAVRERITAGMEAYLTYMIERTPLWMIGPARDIGGANVAEAMDELHDVAFDKLFSGTPRWAKSTTAREAFRIQCYSIELLGSRYRAGALTRDECLAAMVETLMAYRFRILPSIG